VSAEWEGSERWEEKMRRAEALADLSDVFNEAIDEVVIPHFGEQFATEGHGEWAQVMPATARRKRRIYGDRPILQATGAMMRSFTVPGAPHQIRRVGPTDAFFGSDMERAKFHQNARGRRRRKIIDRVGELRKKVRAFLAKRLGEKLRQV
jgi:hypothetical protein